MALIVGLAVGVRFQRGITQPLQRLLAATAKVREQHHYDIALDASGDREVGQLIDGFNAMLSDIKGRDARSRHTGATSSVTSPIAPAICARRAMPRRRQTTQSPIFSPL